LAPNIHAHHRSIITSLNQKSKFKNQKCKKNSLFQSNSKAFKEKFSHNPSPLQHAPLTPLPPALDSRSRLRRSKRQVHLETNQLMRHGESGARTFQEPEKRQRTAALSRRRGTGAFSGAQFGPPGCGVRQLCRFLADSSLATLHSMRPGYA
jgi:hypothetical protein